MRSLVHFVRFCLYLEEPCSQVTSRELQLLIRYSSGARTICEIGCYEGRTSAALARSTTGTVYSVDPFVPGRLGICYGQWIARIYRQRRHAYNLRFLKGFSADVVKTFAVPIDFLFIDGDHSYSAIRVDWADWLPKVADGGIVALHDCKVATNSPSLLGSMQFYSDEIPLFTNVREIDSADSLVVFQISQSGSSSGEESQFAERVRSPNH